MSGSLPEKTTVLIIGAGPSGLSAAISLVHHGCRDIVIVEEKSSRGAASRAMSIHASTLEALDSIGCAESLIPLGIKGQGMVLSDRSKRLLSVDFTSLATYTRFPFLLLLPQSKTEEVLEAHLQKVGIKIAKAEKAVGLRVDSDGDWKVSFESGKIVKARYVLGADGARSTVREMAGIGFFDPAGGSADEALGQLVLADVTFSSDHPNLSVNQVSTTISSAGMFLLVPLPKLDKAAKPIYRIGFNVPVKSGPPPSNLSIPYLQQYVNDQGPLFLSSDPSVNPSPMHISSAIWTTRFRTHAAIAETFLVRMGRKDDHRGPHLLLIGDAAHIHSPAGGQGMNLGIRDAITLGSALTAHIDSCNKSLTSSNTILEEYASTRRSRALATIKLTKRIMMIAGALARSSQLLGIHWLFSLVTGIPLIQRRMAWSLSGLGNR